MSFKDIYYTFPEASYLIVGVFLFPALFWYLAAYRIQKRNEYGAGSILERILLPRSPVLFWIKVSCLSLAWLFTTFALMQPISYGSYPEEISKRRISQGHRRTPQEVILLIDASKSMNVADARDGKTRLEFAKEIGDALLSRLDGQMVALYAFTTGVIPLSPLTTDYLFVRLMLRHLEIDEGGAGGTDLFSALKDMQKEYFKPSQIRKSVVWITDGEDTHLMGLDQENRNKKVAEMLDLFKDAASAHLHVFTVGMGTKSGGTVPGVTFENKPVVSALNEALLNNIGQQGRGRYYYANDFSPIELASDLLTAIQQNAEAVVTETKASSEDNLIHQRYYQIPLGIAILLLACVLCLPDVWQKKKV